MSLPLNNDFAEGTNGTTVTPANSAGTGESAFDVASVGTGATLAYSNAVVPPSGSLSAKVQTGGTSTAAYVQWSSASIGASGVGTLYGRMYWYQTGNIPSATRIVQFYKNGSGGTYCGGIAMQTSNYLVIQNGAYTFVTTFTNAIPLNQWVRIEFEYVFSTSAGQATVTLYNNASGTTVTETHTNTSMNLGSATCDTALFGWTYALANQPAAYMGYLNLNATGFPGPASTTISGGGALTGSGALGTALVSTSMNGSGSMTGAGTAPVTPVGLSGSGTMSGTGTAQGAQLSGSGSMTAAETALLQQTGGLSGSGSMNATEVFGTGLSGSGTMGLAVTLRLVIGLTGNGDLSVPQVAGGLVAGVGGAQLPLALPGSSQVAVAPPGSAQWQWLGTIGQVTALTYSFMCPGGCDKMSATVMVPASYRTQLFNPGWQVRITRGGHDVWHGKLDEPQPSAQGWTLTAVGAGNQGQDFLAIYSDPWPSGQPDESVNNAITRGLQWVNPGIGTPSGAWFGQSVDSGAQTITALLNLVCTRGGLTWYVNSQPGGIPGDDLSVFPLPATVNRLLVCTTPVARTLGGDINTIFIRYCSSADNATSGAAATYGLTSVQNAADVAAHQVIETYIDLSDAGVMSAAAAQAVASQVLKIYQRASFAGPFTASYGQLLNTGGTPIDPGTDQAGTVVRLILTDFGYGGEVTPAFPVTFIVGAYEWNDFAQVATITPYQVADMSLTGMLSTANTVMTPIAVAS